jgi:hypothetical protein
MVVSEEKVERKHGEGEVNERNVDNHECILLSIKNTIGIRNKSDRCPKAAAGQN